MAHVSLGNNEHEEVYQDHMRAEDGKTLSNFPFGIVDEIPPLHHRHLGNPFIVLPTIYQKAAHNIYAV
ncbi:unnamed protein product [Clavelina lepadiformis]|uniref:Uncharacterized protein n=1 Tax=Clavelina lepadiformis TaxID=159417 RepID=A0ABP0FL81_CLALP